MAEVQVLPPQDTVKIHMCSFIPSICHNLCSSIQYNSGNICEIMNDVVILILIKLVGFLGSVLNPDCEIKGSSHPATFYSLNSFLPFCKAPFFTITLTPSLPPKTEKLQLLESTRTRKGCRVKKRIKDRIWRQPIPDR